MHGVSSIGGPHELDRDYLRRLETPRAAGKGRLDLRSSQRSQGNAHQLHDPLPLPYTEESLQHGRARVRQVQDVIESEAAGAGKRLQLPALRR